MRTVRVSTILAALALGAAACAGQTAQQQLSAAEAKAKSEHKNVFVVFHASWCGWCHRLENLMNSAAFKPVFDANYVIVPIDIAEHDANHPETPGGEDVAKQLGADNQGLPFYVILNPEGRALQDSRNGKAGNIGYPSEPSEVAYFEGLLRATAPHVTARQIDRLGQFLAKKSQ